MSIQKFPADRLIRIFGDDETVRMGSFKVAKNGDLQHIRVLTFIRGPMTGTQKIRVKIFSESSYTSLLYTSDWLTLSEISAIKYVASANGWYGWLRLDFDRKHLNKNNYYWLSCEIDNYTRNADTSFFSLVYDSPVSVYDNEEARAFDHPLSFLIYQYEAIS